MPKRAGNCRGWMRLIDRTETRMPASRRNAIKALVTFGNGLPFSVMHCSSHVSRNTTFIGGPSSRKVSTIPFSAWFFDHPPPCTAAILVAHIPCAPPAGFLNAVTKTSLTIRRPPGRSPIDPRLSAPQHPLRRQGQSRFAKSFPVSWNRSGDFHRRPHAFEGLGRSFKSENTKCRNEESKCRSEDLLLVCRQPF